MDRQKLLWLILISIVLLLAVTGAYLVFAKITIQTTIAPTETNGTEFYNSCPFSINLTTNHTTSIPWNMTVYQNDSRIITFPRTKLGNGSFDAGIIWNTSAICFPAGTGVARRIVGPSPLDLPMRYLRILINDTTNATNSTNGNYRNYTWSNTSSVGGMYFFINERAPGTLTISPTGVTNATWYNSGDINISISTNATIAKCYLWNEFNNSLFNYDDGIGLTATNTSKRDHFGDATFSFNTSDLNATWHQVTWMCEDAFGNQSWYNTSATAGFMNFKVDTIDPYVYYNKTIMTIGNSTRFAIETVTNETLYFATNGSYATLAHPTAISITMAGNVSDIGMAGNFTVSTGGSQIRMTADTYVGTGSFVITYTYKGYDVVSSTNGNYVNYTFNASDANANRAYVKIFKPDGTTAELNAISKSAALGVGIKTYRIWEVNITPQYLDKDGVYRFQASLVDQVGRVGNESANNTLLVNNLKANKWNAIAFTESMTLGNISSWSRNISYVSMYWNQFGNKNFTTYKAGMTTYRDNGVNSSANATLIYPNDDITLVRKITNTTMGYLTLGNDLLALTTGGWNFIPVDLNINSTARNELLGQRRFSLYDVMFADACTNKTTQTYPSNVTLTVGTVNETLVLSNATWIPIAFTNRKITSIVSVGNATHEIYPWNASMVGTFNETHIKLTEVHIADAVGEIGWGLRYNVSYIWVENYALANCANITYTSYNNVTTDKWCSAKRGMNATSCSGFTSATISPPLGSGLWILTNVNMSINRTKIAWFDARTS